MSKHIKNEVSNITSIDTHFLHIPYEFRVSFTPEFKTIEKSIKGDDDLINKIIDFTDNANLFIAGGYIIHKLIDTSYIDIDIYTTDYKDVDNFIDTFKSDIIEIVQTDMSADNRLYITSYKIAMTNITFANIIVTRKAKDIQSLTLAFDLTCCLAFYRKGRIEYCTDIDKRIMKFQSSNELFIQYNECGTKGIRERMEKYKKRGFTLIEDRSTKYIYN